MASTLDARRYKVVYPWFWVRARDRARDRVLLRIGYRVRFRVWMIGISSSPIFILSMSLLSLSLSLSRVSCLVLPSLVLCLVLLSYHVSLFVLVLLVLAFMFAFVLVLVVVFASVFALVLGWGLELGFTYLSLTSDFFNSLFLQLRSGICTGNDQQKFLQRYKHYPRIAQGWGLVLFLQGWGLGLGLSTPPNATGRFVSQLIDSTPFPFISRANFCRLRSRRRRSPPLLPPSPFVSLTLTLTITFTLINTDACCFSRAIFIAPPPPFF
jgi:hypothetical protein